MISVSWGVPQDYISDFYLKQVMSTLKVDFQSTASARADEMM